MTNDRHCIDLVDSSSDSSDLLEESEEYEEEYLDCGLPLLDGTQSRVCRACNAAFRAQDVNKLSCVWDDLKGALGRRGYFPQFPTMDDHFKHVFFLFIKDWEGRLEHVDIWVDDEDPPFVLDTSESASSDEYDIGSDLSE